MTDDPIRNAARPLSQEQQLQITEIRTLEEDFIQACNRMGKSRELSLAITNMQQAGHWALDHVLGT